MAQTRKRTRNFVDVIRAKMATDPDLAEAIETASFNADVAMKVYEARTEAGLSQKKLAELVGTQQSVISRIEDAEYEGHSLKLLRRIAKALGKELQIEFYACAKTSPEVVETLSPIWEFPEGWVDVWAEAPVTTLQAPTKPPEISEMFRQTGTLSGPVVSAR